MNEVVIKEIEAIKLEIEALTLENERMDKQNERAKLEVSMWSSIPIRIGTIKNDINEIESIVKEGKEWLREMNARLATLERFCGVQPTK